MKQGLSAPWIRFLSRRQAMQRLWTPSGLRACFQYSDFGFENLHLGVTEHIGFAVYGGHVTSRGLNLSSTIARSKAQLPRLHWTV